LREHLLALISLQRIDLAATQSRGSLDELGEQLQQLRTGLAFLSDELARHEAELLETEALRHENERTLKVHEESIGRSKGRVTALRKSQDYMAVQREIENSRKAIAGKEEEILKILEVEQASRAALAERRERLTELTAQVERYEAAYEERRAETEAEVAELAGEREELLVGLPKPLLRKYDRIREKRGGVALVEVRDEICQGCFMGIRPQLYNELQRGDILVDCPNCQRILYYAGSHDAAATPAAG